MCYWRVLRLPVSTWRYATGVSCAFFSFNVYLEMRHRRVLCLPRDALLQRVELVSRMTTRPEVSTTVVLTAFTCISILTLVTTAAVKLCTEYGAQLG